MKSTTSISTSKSILKSTRATARALLTAPQHIRFFDYVDQFPGVLTWEVARNCGIGFPPARSVEINQKIEHLGLRLICRPPTTQNKNQFGESSRSNAWFIVEIAGVK